MYFEVKKTQSDRSPSRGLELVHPYKRAFQFNNNKAFLKKGLR